MATSPLFGWEEPDDTDLVKDGAAAIRTLGNAIDTSMGDLLGGSSGQVLAKASGTNMDFTWTTPTASPNFVAGKNAIINGAFDFWQRGSSISATNTYAYVSDRWQSLCDGAITGARTAFTPGSAPVSGYEGKYYLRYTKTSGTYWQIQQYIEDVQTFAGQTVTISFWAKVDSAKTIYVQLSQNFGSGGSSTVTTSAGTQALTTSWVRYSFTVAVPSISSKTVGTSSNLALEIGVGATTGNVVFDIWGVQVEAGSTATPFSRAAGTLQGELAACQRYYAKSYNQGTNPATATATGSVGMAAVATGANANIIPCRFPVEMRTAPTVTIYSPNTGTTGKISNISAASDVNATDLGTGSAGFGFYVTGAPGGAVGYWLAGHYQAVAEL